MAGNEWINGYLEAILDAGSSRNGLRVVEDGDEKSNSKNNGSRRRRFVEGKVRIGRLEEKEKEKEEVFNPTKYFVEEVVNSFDESDLHRTWIKVIATRNSRDRSNRLENMCWRIWHLARKKKQIAWDDAQRLTKRRLEREQGRHDAADDLSELSEGEKEKGDPNQIEPSVSPIGSTVLSLTCDNVIFDCMNGGNAHLLSYRDFSGVRPNIV